MAKVARMPWPFWCILLFSLFATSTSIVFKQNATELAEQRFKVSAVTAGWYAALTQYAGFFIVPLVAVFIDFYGQRITLCEDFSLFPSSLFPSSLPPPPFDRNIDLPPPIMRQNGG